MPSVQVRLQSPTVATRAIVTFVLSLKLVKSYVLVMARMCASPTFMLDCENSPGVPGPRARGQGQGDKGPFLVH